jgi:hypothetical protein
MVIKNKFSKKMALGGLMGGPEDPDPKKPVQRGPQYTPQNPNTTPQMNQLHAQNNLSQAVQFKNLLTGSAGNLVPIDKYTQFLRGQGVNDFNQNKGEGYVQQTGYEEIPQQQIQQADSVINASRQMLYPKLFKKPTMAGMASNSGVKGMSKGGKMKINFADLF